MQAMNSQEQPEENDYPATVLGSTALEKLCIAILTAHPERDRASARKPADRLRAAVYALDGYDPTRGDNEKDDYRLLRLMSELLEQGVYREIVNATGGLLGHVQEFGSLLEMVAADTKDCRHLAAVALARAGMPVTEATKKRLARKFKERWRQLRHEAGLAIPPPKFEDECLGRIIELLNEIGIPAIMPNDPGAFWELSIAK
jgi:hypothetical protein